MKKYLIASLLCIGILCSRAFGQTAEQDVINGTNDLANQDIVDANASFQAALALEPTNEDANVLLALTRLLLVPQTPAGSNFLNGLNFPSGGRDIYNWTSAPPKDAFGGPIFPANYNSTNGVYFFRTNVMPLIAASLANLANLTDTNFLLTINVGEQNLGQVTIDYGDVQLFRAMLTAADAFGDTLHANNAGVILPQIVSWADTNNLTIHQVLSTYTGLLTMQDTNDLLPSETALQNAIALYFAASDFIRNDRSPDDTNDLVTISPDETNSEAQFRTDLTNVLSSLVAPTQFDPNDPDSIIYLGAYFSGTNSLRNFVPQFNGDTYVDNTLPDYTFGGILPDEPSYQTEKLFRKRFPSFAGIYIGDNGLSDNDGGSGSFIAYVTTNGTTTLIGNDNGAGSGSPFSFLFNVTFDATGNWSFSNSTVVASANVDKHGDFNAQLFYAANDLQVFLQGNEESPLGSFQNNAGFYTGSFNGTSSGTLDAILASDGEFFYLPIANGQPQMGGNGQFSSATQFSITGIDGTVVSGTLTPSTSAIGGNYNNTGNGSHGSFTLKRTSEVNFDVPPSITTDLPLNQNVALGATVKFSLGVTGSEPLSYQWYFNSNVILGATGSSLSVSNNLWTSTGAYQISATANNVAGGTNSQVDSVNVLPETTTPTVTITSPTPGELWSNATFNVTGTASDKVGVTSVYYYVNSGFYTEATTANNWVNWTAANVALTPGTNTINVIAYNVAGLTATNSVKIVYIQSGVLTVLTNGVGTITPPDNGAVLQIGKVFSLTAAGRDGFKFVNWTGGTNQPLSFYTNGPTVLFTMSNNLTMQANFVDTNKPFLSITNVKTGMLVSNAAFTVMGQATDNVAVASVNYSLNSASFALAVTNGHLWSAAVNLVPGTNTFSAYAVDTTGNISTTDTVKIVYILSATLTVQTNGVGVITPNDNGAQLQIGKVFSLTAAGKDGFKFTDWTGSTNGTFTVLTNGPTVTLPMVSNLVLVANLVDTNKPFLSITNVKTGMLVSNAAFTVLGRATDNVAVASVNYSLNSPLFTTALTNGQSWSAAINLVPGTNTFSAYAVDTSGNISTTNTVKIVYILSATLTVQTNGVGVITPNDNGDLLQIGKVFSLTAVGKDGFKFSNWTGSTNGTFRVLTNGPTVTFAMVSNLVLVANLVDTNKPFISITNVKTGMLVTNPDFTVLGRATDNVAVASVNYSLNNAPYTEAEAGGGSWNAGVVLSPGTNKFSVYAEDASDNVSATDTVLIIRQSAQELFPVATNSDIKHPQAQIAFDGTNYLVVFQVYPPGETNNSSAIGQFVSTSGDLVGSPLALNPNGADDPPYLDFDGTNYLVAWADYSDTAAGTPVKGVFVSPDGLFGEPIQLSQSTNVDNFETITYGGGVYLLAWSDAGTSPDSILGAIIDTSGNKVSGDFLISTNGEQDEAGQKPAAYDGTNFLTAWASANGTFGVSGQLIDTSGNLVGSPIVIYTNTTAAGKGLPCVIFDGTKYLVLFNIGVDSTTGSGYHILGRFVTTTGQVLTNQITLTSDAGPQLVAGADFDGFNYLITWNQGLNPFALTTSATVNGRFFDSNGIPTSAEFPIFKTQGSLIPNWAPVLFDGSQFVSVTGLGKMLKTAPNLEFTNGVIYGSFIAP
jgi:hypothetical protein